MTATAHPGHNPTGKNGRSAEVLSARQQRFVVAYLEDPVGSTAARVAGYRRPKDAGSRLLRRAAVCEAIAKGQARVLARSSLTAEKVLETLHLIATTDMRDFYTEDGALKQPKDWTRAQGLGVSSLDVVKRNLTSGDGKVDTVFKVKLCDRVRALESLAKHFGLLVDRVDHSGAIVFQHEQLDVPVTVEAVRVPETP
jgi:phage terminase small subunit